MTGRCLFCGELLEQRPTLRMTIPTSMGELAVDVDVCVECTATRRVTLLEVLNLARRRVLEGGT